MPIRETESERPRVGGIAKVVAERASAIVRLELELAIAELKRKVVSVGVGIGLAIGGAVFGLLALGFAFATLAAAIATALPTWAALLIVTGTLVGLAVVLVLIGRVMIKRGTPPIPEQAIQEAKLTAEALKRNGDH